MLKCFWNEELGWHQSVMVNYDWYSPVSPARATPREVRGWCADAGLEVEHLDGDRERDQRAGLAPALNGGHPTLSGGRP